MALFDFTSFKMLEKGLDATWLKTKVIQHNMANSTTPGYKAKSVEFRALIEEKCKCRYHVPKQEEQKIDFNAVITEEPNTNQTLDENNVDPIAEQIKLADAQFQYSQLIDKANNDFTMLRNALQR